MSEVQELEQLMSQILKVVDDIEKEANEQLDASEELDMLRDHISELNRAVALMRHLIGQKAVSEEAGLPIDVLRTILVELQDHLKNIKEE